MNIKRYGRFVLYNKNHKAMTFNTKQLTETRINHAMAAPVTP